MNNCGQSKEKTMVSKDFMDSYVELFNTIFTFVIPCAKLLAIWVGVNLLIDLQWIVHQIRRNAEGYNNDDKGVE